MKNLILRLLFHPASRPLFWLLVLSLSGCASYIEKIGQETVSLIALVISILGAAMIVIGGILILINAYRQTTELSEVFLWVGAIFLIMGMVALAPGLIAEFFRSLAEQDAKNLEIPNRRRP